MKGVNDKTIRIGKRLSQFFQDDGVSNTIFPNRVLNPLTMKQTVTLSEKDKICLGNMINHTSSIHIIEDVIVTGKTLENVLNIIRSISPKQSIYIQSFTANQFSCEKLLNSFQPISIETAHIMTGHPIKQSTLLRLYDLMHKKINGKFFIQHESLMKRFFPNDYYNLLTFIEYLKTYIK
jgi:hypothetical protein